MQFVELMLREIGDVELGRAHDAAFLGLEPFGDQLGEGGLAVAVRAEQRDAVVVVDAQIRPDSIGLPGS
jgi:hypothetical protein